jgi:Mrp family chromosome partitioning ATPase/capsular polysaccharide biosynthesis protein
MNYTSLIVRPAGAHEGSLPGRDHIDLCEAGRDSGATLIGDLIAAVRRRALVLVLWILFCVAAGITHVLLAQPEFVAAAQIALEPRVRLPPGADAAAAAAATAPTLDSAQAESQVQVIRSARNLRYVFDTLGIDADPAYAAKGPGLIDRTAARLPPLLPFLAARPLPPEEAAARAREMAFQNFAERVQVKRLGQSYVLEVSFRGLTPQDAARLTNAIAAAYIRDQVLVRAASDQRGTEFLQGRIALIQAEKKAADEAVATGVITDFQFPDSDARIVGAALRPLAAAYPQTKLILLLAASFGLVSGVGCIAVLHSFDRTVRSPAQIRSMLGVDCYLVPRFEGGRLTETTALDRPASEFALALRLLRTVLFAGGDEVRHSTVGLVACQKEAGCSTLGANLAFLLATSSDRVALVDANLQDPELTHRFAPRATAGLDSLVLSPAVGADLPEIALSPSLSFVPAVAAGRPADPNAFLGTHAMRAALERHQGRRDSILDLPPLDASSDAQAIGHMLTGIVLVASRDRTTLDQLRDAIRDLRSANCRVLGIVLNDSPRSRRAWRRARASA